MLKVRPFIAVLGLLVAFSVAVYAEENKGADIGAGILSIGFDEGFQARVYVLDNVTAHIGFGYAVTGPDTIGRQPLNRIAWKLGGEYVLKKFEKLRLAAFLEWRQECNQGETIQGFRTDGGNHVTLRYNQWNTIFRVGVRPELFITDRLSIDYKIGMEYIHYGPDYKLNANGTDTESRRNDYDEFGFYSGRAPFLQNTSYLLGFGLNIYVANLPFWPF